MKPIEWITIGNARLACGDCRDILPTLEKVDAVITDPPYGISYQSALVNLGATRFEKIANDESAPELSGVFALDVPSLLFGANCYPHLLPHRGRWFCWDKRTVDGAADAMLGSPFELAWSNKKSGYDKICRVLHGGVVNADGGARLHPTQKPVRVMEAAILWAAKDASVICDPFMGSGSTGIACLNLARAFIGIEIDPKHFETACRRIEDAQRQQRLFA